MARVVRHPAFAEVPFVLETPGLEGHGPDVANLTVAKAMRSGLPAAAAMAAAAKVTARTAAKPPTG